jgi:reactive intermediate/imine deaminase
MTKRAFLPVIALLAACATHSAATYVKMPGPVTRPFSAAVVVNGMVYLSGQIGVDSTGAKPVAGGIGPETQAAMESVKKLLEANGSSMNDVVKCSVMLADIGEWAQMNAVYVTFFPDNKPARSAFGTSGLALGARVEIECVGAVRAK